MTPPDTAPGLELHARPNGKKQIVVAVMGTETLFSDELNPSVAKDRQKFAAALTEKCPGLECGVIEAKLLGLAPVLPAGSPPEGPKDAPDLLAGTPQDIIDEANELLRNPELIARVCDAAAAVGVAGERELVATVYLLGVSRLLDKPLAAIIRGSSSSGKSYTVDAVASLFPPEALIRATQMTSQALFHMPQGSLIHKWVVCGERSRKEDDDRAEATRALREMLSSQQLSKLMPVRVGNNIETKRIEQAGPIAFTETTTLTKVFEEDANRCLLLQTDEGAQTRRIIRELARSHTTSRAGADRVVQVHHALQRMLPRARVRVPFADRIAERFDCNRVEVRRAFRQLLALIQASALLHYRQRKTDADGTVIADANDYHLARRLIARPFAQSLGGGLTNSATTFLHNLTNHRPGEFESKQIAKQLSVSESGAAAALKELQAAGAVEIAQPARGSQPAVWRLTGKIPDPGQARLPSVEDVFPEGTGRMDATPNPLQAS